MNPGKNPKRRTVTERFAEKNPERSVASFVYVSVFWKLFGNYFLEKAKYEQLPKKDLDRLNEYVELPERGLQVRCNVSDYALAEIWWKV